MYQMVVMPLILMGGSGDLSPKIKFTLEENCKT